MNLPYFIATLPTLELDLAPAIDIETFVALCREQLSAELAVAVEALIADGEAPHRFVQNWRDKETILRNAIARQRAVRRGADQSSYARETHGSDLYVEQAVEAAFMAGDPLVRERQIDALRWRLAEELQGVDPLDEQVVLAYAIKLSLSQRWAARTIAAGRSRATLLTEQPITLAASR